MRKALMGRACGALGTVLVPLALAACDPTPPSPPNPTADAPVPGASVPTTTGSADSPGTGATYPGTGAVADASVAPPRVESGTTGAAPSPSARLGSPSGLTGSPGVTATTGAAATAGTAAGTGTDAAGQDRSTETASTMGGSAAAGVPSTEMPAPIESGDARRAAPTLEGSAATAGTGGHSGSGTTAGLPGTAPGRDATGAMSGGTGTPLDGSRSAAGSSAADAARTEARGDGPRQGGGADPTTAGSPSLTRAEEQFLIAAAASGNFEVAMARLATERGQSEEVTRYAQMLSQHHAQANRQLQELALERGVTLPTDVPDDKQAELSKLSQARGAEFDRLFVQNVGLETHREDIALFERAAREARDPQVKAFAERMLPLLRQHRQAAQQLAANGSGAGARDAAGGSSRP